MKAFLRGLIMYLCFTMEIQVHAASLQQPTGCWNQKISNCSVFNLSELKVLKTDNFDIRLNEKSVLKRVSEDQITLISGYALVESNGAGIVKTLYGEILMFNARVLMKVDDKRVVFTALKGKVGYLPRGSVKSGQIPAGYSNFMSRVSTSGVAPSGYADPAMIEPLINAWANMFQKSEKNIFLSQIKEFRGNWRQTIEVAGPWYVETIGRQIASLREEREHQRKIQEARIREQEFYREMFRRRNFLDE